MIVACELVKRDRDSFDEWWPQHLAAMLELADLLYLRVDNDTYEDVVATLTKFVVETAQAAGIPTLELWSRIAVDRQSTEYGRWQEDAERDALLDWAQGENADWCAVFDADEVIEPGGGGALRQLLQSPRSRGFRVLNVHLNYVSHHRPGFVLPRCDVKPPRVFRLDAIAALHRFRADSDGLHCGSVPQPQFGAVKAPDLRVLHFHATSPGEYMAEREFYDNTVEVARNGGIDWLYRCDRFGNEADAVPVEELLAGRDERLARIAAGVGLTA